MSCRSESTGLPAEPQHLVHQALQYLALLLVMALVGIGPVRAAVDDTRPGNPPDDAAPITLAEVATGELLFRTAVAGEYVPAVQLHTRADIQVNGFIANIDVVQRFKNTTRDWVEGVYVFPLPETAAVNAMELRIGERVIVGEIREKQQAREAYAAARKQGRKAALVEQRRPNLFATAVTNIAPGQEVEVHLSYVETIMYDSGTFTLRFPMTITPRYIPGARTQATEAPLGIAPGSGWAANTDQVPDAAEITPFLQPRRSMSLRPRNPIELFVRIDPGLPLAGIASTYHEIQVVRQSGIYAISLTGGPVPMDRDFELTWQPAVGFAPRAALFTEQLDGQTYALAMILPPEQNVETLRLPRETVFIIDTSGSMGGEPMRQAKAALQVALSRLGAHDRFNVIAFNDWPSLLFNEVRPATPQHLSTAQDWVGRLQSGGGTEMMRALDAALLPPSLDSGEYLRQVIFITDGAVGNEAALFRSIAGNLGDRRLFMVGIGAAPNRHFMRKAARFGRGHFTHIGRQDEVERKMEVLFDRLEKPLLRDIRLDWPAGSEALTQPDPVPDLYAGQPIIVTARLATLGGTVSATGLTAAGAWQQSLELTASRSHRGVATLWAREQLAAMNDQIALQGETDERRARMLKLALRHQLLSRYTSFLAVEQKPSRPLSMADRSRAVPNLRPHGQSPQPFAYPQTATSSVEAFWFGLVGLIATALLWFRVMTIRVATAPQGPQR
ncbi:MAG: marine proteobacterial sortase target protein [Gammaproteobacteria bacterium]|nr:MAG: marine proteobacterial sortase target protein [Gammaproteobacteria bacterium]